MTIETTVKNQTEGRIGSLTLTNLIKALMICVAFSAFAFVQNAYAQNSTIETKTYKKNIVKPKKKTPKKPAKKPTKKKSSVKKSVPKKVTPKKKVRKKPKRVTRKKPVRRNTNLTKVIFGTEAPNQEIWRGNQKIGVTNDDAILEKWMAKGNYLVSVRNPNGETTISSLLISVEGKSKEIKLRVSEIDSEPENTETTAEQAIEDPDKEALDAAERIGDILKRYGDPLKTNTVTLADWEFIYQTAQANNVKGFTAIQIEAQRWFSSGQIELAKGNYSNAFTGFKKAIEFMPDSAYPFYALGDAHRANRQFRAALNSYLRAISVNPKFALAHRKIGDLHLKAGREKEAILSYETAVANGFDTPAVRFDLGKAYKKSKRWSEASREFAYVVKEAPTADVYVMLGEIYLHEKRNISAYEAFKKSTELAPDSAIGFYKLGNLLYDEREYVKAKEALEAALTIDKNGKDINVSQTKKMIRESAQKIK